MTPQLQVLLDRVDALSLRERLFLTLSLLVCVLALADFVWLTPAQAAHKQLLQRFATQGAELDRLRTELALAAVPTDTAKLAHAELLAVDSQLAELDTQIAALAPTESKGPPLEQVLQRLLRRHEGLTLVSLDTQKAEASVTGAGAGAAGALALPPGMRRRGLLLKVSGPYAELARYVQALESALPGMRWGPMELKADKRGNELSLQVYALGVQP